jgi:hypothetical protein
MRTANLIPRTSARRMLGYIIVLAISGLLVICFADLSFAQESRAKTFSSPGEACKALLQAVQNGDEQTLETILGAGKEVTSSSDEVEDKLEREQFSQKYQEMHRLVREPDGSTVLYIGAENWPFPIPLVSKNGEWYFDSDHGKQEILFRTIGEDEMTAIQVCDAFANAKKQYQTAATTDDPISQYVKGLVGAGNSNTRDNSGASSSTPFHGYYFRVVSGNSAETGSTHTSEKKTGGLLLVAYPAEYRTSGVMTFIVKQNGAVYQKDLGPDTATIAANMKKRSSGSGWQPAK